MAIKDSIVNLKKGLRTTLTNVPALIDTLVRGLDGVAEAVEEENTYSTTNEQEIGTWIDGSKIFRKTFNFPTAVSIPTNTWTEVEIPTAGMEQIINVKTYSTKYCHGYIGANSTATKVQLLQTREVTISVSIVVLEYTKTNTSRTPENANKNGNEKKNDEVVKNER